MNCAKRSCSAQAACVLPRAWPLPGLISVEGIMIRRIMLLMGPDLPLSFHPRPARALGGKRLDRDIARDDGVDLVAALDKRFNKSMDNLNVCSDQRRRLGFNTRSGQKPGDAATATLANAFAST